MVTIDSRPTVDDPVAGSDERPPPRPPLPTHSGGDDHGRRKSSGWGEALLAIGVTVALIGGLYLIGHDDGSSSKSVAAGATPVDDKGFSKLANGHEHPHAPDVTLDVATQAKLDRQLALTREVAKTYATVADAEAAGYRRAGPFYPGLGAHYINYGNGKSLNADGVVDDDDIRAPLSIIYAGTDPTSEITGFMYYSVKGVDAEPEGFEGPNDHWHYHDNVCLAPASDGKGGVDAPLGADLPITEAQCKAAGGNLMKQTTWMVHVWTVPGYDLPDDVFANVNKKITCDDGTYYTMPQADITKYRINLCKSSPA